MTTPIAASSISPFDVLFGRSARGVENHNGNIAFRVLIETYAPQYSKQNQGAGAKSAIVAEIIAKVKRHEGRFLRFSRGAWREINGVIAKYKVSQTLKKHALALSHANAAPTRRRSNTTRDLQPLQDQEEPNSETQTTQEHQDNPFVPRLLLVPVSIAHQDEEVRHLASLAFPNTESRENTSREQQPYNRDDGRRGFSTTSRETFDILDPSQNLNARTSRSGCRLLHQDDRTGGICPTQLEFDLDGSWSQDDTDEDSSLVDLLHQLDRAIHICDDVFDDDDDSDSFFSF